MPLDVLTSCSVFVLAMGLFFVAVEQISGKTLAGSRRGIVGKPPFPTLGWRFVRAVWLLWSACVLAVCACGVKYPTRWCPTVRRYMHT